MDNFLSDGPWIPKPYQVADALKGTRPNDPVSTALNLTLAQHRASLAGLRGSFKHKESIS